MKREDAEDLLFPREDGLFLVRESNNFPGDYTLCVCADGKVEHYHIIYKQNKLTIDEEEYFENLNQLVEVTIATTGLAIVPDNSTQQYCCLAAEHSNMFA